MTKSRNILAPRHHWTELELSALTKRYANERTEDIANDIETQHTENGDSLSLIASVLRQQQAEIEALKAIINEAFKSIPAMGEDGEFYHEHHGMDGEYLGYENIPANYVVQVIEAILRKASEK